jgi:type VI secretion system protein ImpL
VQFLVDIGRPSQLSTNPVLRGFYFTGVRPVIVTDSAAAESRKSTARSGLLTDATGIFHTPGGAAPEPAYQEPMTRKVPQWVFLGPLLPSVILQDRAALGLSRASTKVSFRRRLILSLATATAVLLGIAWTISYFNNRALVGRRAHTTTSLPAGGDV